MSHGVSPPRPLRAGAIVLAAGEGRRMGRPKALLPLEGRTFLEVLLGRFRDAEVAPAVVVLGTSADEILQEVPPGGALFVRNPDPSRGQLSSVHCGLDALAGKDLDAVFLAPVDVPRVRADTLRRMVSALPGRRLVVPRFGGKRGHPALFGRDLFPALREAPKDRGSRAVVHAESSRLELDVDDAAVLEDFDRPEDLPPA